MTEFEFIQKINEKYDHKVTVLTPYQNQFKKIECKCKICGHKWKTTPYLLIDKRGRCPECKKLEPGYNATNNAANGIGAIDVLDAVDVVDVVEAVDSIDLPDISDVAEVAGDAADVVGDIIGAIIEAIFD